MNQIEKAIAFATKAHAGQFRKGTDRHYILHAIETMIIAMRLYLDDDAIAAAVLHDVVENTSVTLRRIEKEFGPRVADLVDSVTEDKMKKLPPEATWRARKWQMIFRLRKADRDTLGICLADNLSNLRELNRDYEIIGDEIWERFNQKDKAMQAWYYKEIRDIVKQKYEYEYYEEMEEYADLIYPLFNQKEHFWE